MEKPIVLGLNGEEIQHALLYKLGESLEKTCHLTSQCSYTAFKAKIRVEIILDDYGRETPDNHIVEVSDGNVSEEARTVTAEIDIEKAPPNQVRVETGQDVPVQVVKDGKTEVKRVRYQRKKAVANA